MMDVERTTMVAVAVGPGDKSAAYRDLGSSSDPNMYYAQEGSEAFVGGRSSYCGPLL